MDGRGAQCPLFFCSLPTLPIQLLALPVLSAPRIRRRKKGRYSIGLKVICEEKEALQ